MIVDKKYLVVDYLLIRGNWTGVQLLERTAYYSISLNLVTYLVQVLHQGTAQSSTTIYNWAGAVWILPLLGGFLADAYTGQFWMIFASAVIYLLVINMLKSSGNLLICQQSILMGVQRNVLPPEQLLSERRQKSQRGLFSLEGEYAWYLEICVFFFSGSYSDVRFDVSERLATTGLSCTSTL